MIASGSAGHLHAYWLLRAPVSIAAAEAANRRLAAQLRRRQRRRHERRDDPAPARHLPPQDPPPTPVVLERLDAQLTTLRAVTAGIAADPDAPATRSTAAAPERRGRAATTRCAQLEPARLRPRAHRPGVGRSRKISCPLHEDRTPSFHVYERADQGWYCFGCRRHGQTVYDLAAAIWQLQTRGAQFLELRARLYALLLPGQTPPRRRRAAPISDGHEHATR